MSQIGSISPGRCEHKNFLKAPSRKPLNFKDLFGSDMWHICHLRIERCAKRLDRWDWWCPGSLPAEKLLKRADSAARCVCFFNVFFFAPVFQLPQTMIVSHSFILQTLLSSIKISSSDSFDVDVPNGKKDTAHISMSKWNTSRPALKLILPSPSTRCRMVPLQGVNSPSLTPPKTNSSPQKRMVSKRNLLFQGSIFRFHVSFRGEYTPEI